MIIDKEERIKTVALSLYKTTTRAELNYRAVIMVALIVMNILMKVLLALEMQILIEIHFDADESIEIEQVDENDHRRDSSICKGIQRRSSTSQKHQQQQPSQQPPRRILKIRSISRSISKLLVRNSKEISLPKVHISSS